MCSVLRLGTLTSMQGDEAQYEPLRPGGAGNYHWCAHEHVASIRRPWDAYAENLQ